MKKQKHRIELLELTARVEVQRKPKMKPGFNQLALLFLHLTLTLRKFGNC